jgi:BirA family biotin operon repressor/biotin-[acetyl-CoA-carboxylase] ligase
VKDDEQLLLALVMRLWGQSGHLMSWEHLGADVRGHDRTVSALSRLLEMGFDVRLAPSGVRLVPPEDTPCSHELLQDLGVATVCSPVVDSTNTIASMLAKAGAPHGTIVLAEAQLRGRGRHGTPWFSPAGLGIWFSMVQRPISPLPAPGLVSLLAGLCVIRVLRRTGADDLVLKWANDVLWHRQKLCGVLVERVESGIGESYVTGIGINVHQREHDFPQDIRPKSVSLGMISKESANRAALLVAIAREMLDAWARGESAGFAAVPEEWNAESGILGTAVRAGVESELLTGTIEGVNQHGGLILRTTEGTRRTLVSGRIELMT